VALFQPLGPCERLADSAEKILEEFLPLQRQPEAEFELHVALARLHLMRGDMDSARGEAQLASDTMPERVTEGAKRRLEEVLRLLSER
jgi:lipopolysaccharide biosynthesis regulator YciM